MSLSPLNLDKQVENYDPIFWKIKHTMTPQSGGTRRRSPQQTPKLSRSRSHRSPVSNNRTIQYVLLERIRNRIISFNCLKKMKNTDLYTVSDCISATIFLKNPKVCHLDLIYYSPLCGVSYTDKKDKRTLKNGDGRYMVKMFISFIRKRAPSVEYFTLDDASMFSFEPIKTKEFSLLNQWETEIYLKPYFSVLYGKTYYQREYGAYWYKDDYTVDLTEQYNSNLQNALNMKPDQREIFHEMDTTYYQNYKRSIVEDIKDIYNESANIGEFFKTLREITQDDFMYYFEPFAEYIDYLIFVNKGENEKKYKMQSYAIRANNTANHLRISVSRVSGDKYKT